MNKDNTTTKLLDKNKRQNKATESSSDNAVIKFIDTQKIYRQSNYKQCKSKNSELQK